MATDVLPAAPHTIDEWISSYEGEGPLRGFRCPACGLITATWGLACPRCGHVGFGEQPLASVGSVLAFTILNVPGDQFLNEAPYAYVVVELDGGGRITGWMPDVRTADGLTIGDRVRFRPSYKPGLQFFPELGSGSTPPGA